MRCAPPRASHTSTWRPSPWHSPAVRSRSVPRWPAHGRLAHAAPAGVAEHLRACAACTQGLARQHRLGQVLTEPERVTYAPGPSLRKLMERSDGRAPAKPQELRAVGRRSAPSALAAAWRPPGLAWAASFVLAVGLAAFAPTAYRWSQPRYATHTTSERDRKS